MLQSDAAALAQQAQAMSVDEQERRAREIASITLLGESLSLLMCLPSIMTAESSS